jgi:hypothetical protein
MTQSTHLTTIYSSHETAVTWASRELESLGLKVVRSFDLQVARAAHVDCSCPHHGTAQCDCQMVVMLVYGNMAEPLTLVAHSRDGKTHFTLVQNEQLSEVGFIDKVTAALYNRRFEPIT